MTAKIRNLERQFAATHSAKYKNLLVSGCSFTWNNSEKHLCSWPYYLRDLAKFEQVYDCSQSGAGSNHIFNSVINEIQTNPNLSPDDTLVIVMWSGLTRTDVIANSDITGTWHQISNYNFDRKFATLSIFNSVSGSSALDKLCESYKQIVDVDAQIYESAIKIIALTSYLKERKYNYVMLSWKDPTVEFNRVVSPIVGQAKAMLDPVEYLDEHAKKNKELDGHPTPDGYLKWTKECLLPYLCLKDLATNLDSI
jgi:hypothetical protein